MARAGAKRSTRKLKIARSLGVNLWGQAKSPFNKRKYKPGQHGPTSRGGNSSDYAKQMRAKQTLKGYYGNVGEKKFRKYYLEAANMKGDTPENLIGLLERRLDAVVYRAKLAPTVFSSRQLISHGHINVNGKRVKIASYQVKPGDVITVSEKAKQMPLVVLALESAERNFADYVSVDSANFTATFVRVPAFEDVPYPVQMFPELVVEFYSR
ncbi:MAG: 30S ribosomal protein S4 [Alphaproteobacteria bacterium]|nr:30S ribosomal protein S4 [Alphaproteobacteria bacterium]MBQ4130693.1 30S ribosomal protein S4 [Alphaproteobacteria bacterium]MBQ8368244.1 30S ribosomal protein S4 [Alphaproteobacteria bacterium]MBR5566864.1 30S ribosomal protein S4 [Alphaproteobacteria bacterium]